MPPARLTFAMARHAVVDLCAVFGLAPTPPPVDRLPPSEERRPEGLVAAVGVRLCADEAAVAKFGALRAMYEPYVQGAVELPHDAVAGMDPAGRRAPHLAHDGVTAAAVGPLHEARDRPALRRRSSGEVEGHLVHVAPPPALRRVVALDDRVGSFLEVTGRMPVGGIVTTTDMAAGSAQAKMHPGATRLETFLASKRARRDAPHSGSVAAFLGHVFHPFIRRRIPANRRDSCAPRRPPAPPLRWRRRRA